MILPALPGNYIFQGAIDILSSRNLSGMSLFGAHLDFKSAVFRF